MNSEPKILTRDVEAAVVPVGTKVTLQKGEQAHITQSLGGSYTVIVNGNMFRIADKDADALGLEVQAQPAAVPAGENNFKADVKMTLTAPGCGMGPTLAQDVQNKLLNLEPIDEANVELVWDPPWNQGMMTEAAKLQLGLM